MTAQHTPSPWAVDDEIPPSLRPVFCRVGSGTTYGQNIPISAPEGSMFPREVPDEEMRANARLIAAAPELLAVVRGMEWGGPARTCPWCGNDRDGGVHIDTCRLASVLREVSREGYPLEGR